jgi:energy-coupling factor transporter ATP-binding protein EcfA2
MEIELKNLKYIVNNYMIFENISYKFLNKKIYTILGPAGCGKTILSKLLHLDILPTKGEIYFDDSIVYNGIELENIKQIRKKIGYVGQDMYEHLFFKTVKEKFLMALGVTNLSDERKEKKIVDVLKIVELENNILYREPLTLSSGELTKVSLASALLINPKLLLLDEPTKGLDAYEKKNFINTIKLIKRKYGKVIIIFTKDLELASVISDDIVFLNDKKIIKGLEKKNIMENIELLKINNIVIPKIIEFKLLASNKNIKLRYNDERNDLIKDILREL